MEGKPPGWIVQCGRPPDNHPAVSVGDSAFLRKGGENAGLHWPDNRVRILLVQANDVPFLGIL
jgi:hypothetical protein